MTFTFTSQRHRRAGAAFTFLMILFFMASGARGAPDAVQVRDSSALPQAADSPGAVQLNPSRSYTTLTLSANVRNELRRAAVSLAAVPPARREGARYVFEMVSGSADPVRGEASGQLAGGLAFRHGRRAVAVRSLSEQAGTAAWIKGQVGRAGLHTVLKLRLGTPHTALGLGGLEMTVTGMQATISGIAAHALDSALRTRVFTAGMQIGTATTVVAMA